MNPANSDQFQKWILPSLHNCFYLTGPTSSGKTSLALSLAEALNAEIISLDSMAIYQEMDIGTAKPTGEQRSQIPHHMLDLIQPTETYSVSVYVQTAHQVAQEIQSRGKQVLFVGGTPLYLKSLLRGLFLGPEADWEFRNSVERDLVEFGAPALQERLAQVDPLLAHKLHPNDTRRMIRGLEVAKITGKPLSHWQQQFDEPASKSACPTIVLRLERSWLHQRINARVDFMLANGLIDEAESLLAKYQSLSRTAAQAVGYREVIQFLNSQLSLEEMREAVKAHTRQFARRQEIWFRSLSELQPLEVTEESKQEELVTGAMRLFRP